MGVRLDIGEFVKVDYIILNMEVIFIYKYLIYFDI